MFDGACSMARGIAAGGAVLYDEHGTELAWEARFLQRVTTPVAEYTGLQVGLLLAARYAGAQARQSVVTAWGDAELIVRQVDGRYVCRKPHLLVLLEDTRSLMEPFLVCVVRELPKAGPKHKRRWSNVRVDQIAGECLEAGRNLSSERDGSVTRLQTPAPVPLGEGSL